MPGTVLWMFKLEKFKMGTLMALTITLLLDKSVPVISDLSSMDSELHTEIKGGFFFQILK